LSEPPQLSPHKLEHRQRLEQHNQDRPDRS
jgi:hypothetical protein